jgi:hypothetical protein
MNKSTCQQCAITFIPKHKSNSNKYCSQGCYWAAKKGNSIPWNKGTKGLVKPNSGTFKKGCTPWHAGTKGAKPAPSTAFKKGCTPWHAGKSGVLHPAWKGDAIGYAGVHTWMHKTFGKPPFCEACTYTKHIDWANASGDYRRDRTDWLMLCRSCHQIYDKSKGGKEIILAKIAELRS